MFICHMKYIIMNKLCADSGGMCGTANYDKTQL